MPKEQRPPFKAVHPTLAALLKVMEQLAAARREYSRTMDWVGRTGFEIEPTRWTSQIEAALAAHDQTKLDGIQTEYDEKAITFMSALICDRVARGKFMDGRMAISEAIRDVVEAHKAIPERSNDAWLRAVMEGACIVAAQDHSFEPEQARFQNQYEMSLNGYETGRNSLASRAEKIMYAAFRLLAEQLGKGTCNPAYYTTDYVVQGCKVPGKEYLNRDVELRHVYAVEYTDYGNTKYPASALLKELLDKLEMALRDAREASSALKSEHNGSVNEHNYAGRLMSMLHQEGRGDGSSFQGQVDAQNERRWLYELERHNYHAALQSLKAALEAAAVALRDAVTEGLALVEETRHPSSATVCVTVDKYEQARVIMNNCLAADLLLRAIGRELKSLQSILGADFSDGAGARALQAKFAVVERQYQRYVAPVSTRDGGKDSTGE